MSKRGAILTRLTRHLLPDIKLFWMLEATEEYRRFESRKQLATVKDNHETGRACFDENKYRLLLLGNREAERDTRAVFRWQTFRIVGFICEEARESQAIWSRRASHVLGAKLNNSLYDDKNLNARKIRFTSGVYGWSIKSVTGGGRGGGRVVV